MSELAVLALVGDMLVRATPLILTGLAVAFAFQAGILNIGAEGQLLIGATCSAAITLQFGETLGGSIIIVSLIGGSLAGAGWAAIAAELRARFHVLEVISTIMLNFIALYIVSFLVRGPLQEPTHIYPQTETMPLYARLPTILPGTRLHAGFVLAVLAGVTGWWILQHSAAGFRLRAAGKNSSAARIAGQIDVGRTTRNVFLMSGALAGLAGAVEIHGVTFALYENLSPGYGYTAIAVALLASLNPLLVIVTGLFFGVLEAGANALQRDAGIPSTIASVIEALIILAVLAVESIRNLHAPQPGSPSDTPIADLT